VVRKLASVLEAAAVGVPVEGKGERVKVYIVLREGEAAFPRQPVTRERRFTIRTREAKLMTVY
jgi:acyl-coenzyme A synthetase/AMP-(fatty) acid ligase